MSNVIPFEFDSQQLRTVLIDEQPWFVAADVCASLSIGNVSLAVNGRADRESDGLDEDERGIATVNTPSGTQEMLGINESGFLPEPEYCSRSRLSSSSSPISCRRSGPGWELER